MRQPLNPESMADLRLLEGLPRLIYRPTHAAYIVPQNAAEDARIARLAGLGLLESVPAREIAAGPNGRFTRVVITGAGRAMLGRLRRP
jgi:hypothetical protein